MKREEVLRLVDSIHRDKSIPRESLFEGLRYALAQAASKVFTIEPEEADIHINKQTGDIQVFVQNKPVDMSSGELGRIAAQTTKQYFKAKILEAEKDMIVEEFADKIRTLITVEVLRKDRGNIVVSVLGHGFEAIIPREEQVPSERYRTGDRLRCYICSMNSKTNRASLVLSRAKPELVHELFISDVPEIADDLIVVQELAREPGFRTKIAVHCDDPRIDCVGACVGPRGTRIRNIINELGGEKIDIIRWSDIPETFIANSLAPARISRVYVDRDEREAIVVVPDDQLSLAIGKKGQNVRLTCRLTRWGVDVKSESEFEEDRENGTIPYGDDEESEETKKEKAGGFLLGDDPVESGSEEKSGDSSSESTEAQAEAPSSSEGSEGQAESNSSVEADASSSEESEPEKSPQEGEETLASTSIVEENS